MVLANESDDSEGVIMKLPTILGGAAEDGDSILCRRDSGGVQCSSSMVYKIRRLTGDVEVTM